MLPIVVITLQTPLITQQQCDLLQGEVYSWHGPRLFIYHSGFLLFDGLVPFILNCVCNHLLSRQARKRRRSNLGKGSAGGIFLSQPLRDSPPYIRCLVAYYAELDLQNERQAAPASVTDETLRKYSPIYHLSSKNGQSVPPIFIARAGLDDTDLNDGVDRFVQVALSRNVTVDFVNHATGHHGFDIEDNNDRSREIIKHTIRVHKEPH